MAEEYIKKSDAIKAIKSWASIHLTVDLIKEIPAEDVVPVRHGKWENEHPIFCWNKYGFYQTAFKCSVCGELTPIDYNICPWCAAKMDGE